MNTTTRTGIVKGCPNDLDERAELYCLNRLSIEESAVFEDHLVVCPACLADVLSTDVFLESLHLALEETANK